MLLDRGSASSMLGQDSTPMMLDQESMHAEDDIPAGFAAWHPARALDILSAIVRHARISATSFKRTLTGSPHAEEMTLRDVPEMAQTVVLLLWSRTSRRIRVAVAIALFFLLSLWLSTQLLDMPRVSLEYAPPKEQMNSTPEVSYEPVQPIVSGPPPLDPTKVALLVENRPQAMLAPLMLHFISVVPPDWRFRFMGSPESVEHINKSAAIREQVRIGKLDLTYIPSNMSTAGQEMISRFMTTLWLYDTVLRPAEILLVFQTDSMICANSRHNLNEYIHYDWIGAPWDPNGSWGGNGGLSIRRVKPIVEILQGESRVDGSEPEDVWLSRRLAGRPDARMANGTVSLTFSGEMNSGLNEYVSDEGLVAAADGDYVKSLDAWRDGFYEPMGYHTGGSGTMLHSAIWGTPERRAHIWKYCPEVKMTLYTDIARYVPGQCHANWRRDDAGLRDGELIADADAPLLQSEYPFGTEIIHGVEYPLLPPGLREW